MKRRFNVRLISMSFVLSALLLVPFSSQARGDWGYPGHENIDWVDEDTIYFNYRFDVYANYLDTNEYEITHQGRAEHEVIDDGSLMIVRERHLPSCEPVFPMEPLGLYVLDLSTDQKLLEVDNVSGYSISSDGGGFAVRSNDELRMYSIPGLELMSTYSVSGEYPFRMDHITWDLDRNLYGALTGDRNASIRYLDTGEEYMRIPTKYSEFGFSPDGRYLHIRETSDLSPFPLNIYDVGSKELVKSLLETNALDEPWVGDMFYCRSGRFDDVYGDPREYYFFSTDTWEKIGTVEAREETTSWLTWNDDHSMFLTLDGYLGDDDEFIVKIYQTNSFREVENFTFDEFQGALAFSPDSSMIAYGGRSSDSGPNINIHYIEDPPVVEEGEVEAEAPLGLPLILMLLIPAVFLMYARCKRISRR